MRLQFVLCFRLLTDSDTHGQLHALSAGWCILSARLQFILRGGLSLTLWAGSAGAFIAACSPSWATACLNTAPTLLHLSAEALELRISSFWVRQAWDCLTVACLLIYYYSYLTPKAIDYLRLLQFCETTLRIGTRLPPYTWLSCNCLSYRHCCSIATNSNGLPFYSPLL